MALSSHRLSKRLVGQQHIPREQEVKQTTIALCFETFFFFFQISRNLIKMRCRMSEVVMLSGDTLLVVSPLLIFKVACLYFF